MPIRLARLKSTALELEVEIQGTVGPLRAVWTQTVMERYDYPVNKKFNHYLQKFIKTWGISMAKHDFVIIGWQADEQVEQSEASSDGEAQWQSESSSR